MCWSTRYNHSLLPNRCIEFFSICFPFIWDLHVVHSSVIIPYSGRDRPSQGSKTIVLDDDLLTQFLDPPPGAAMLQKLFLQQRLRHHWFLRDGPSTDTLITNYNLSPKFVAKTERVVMCPPTVPASCGARSSRNILLGVSHHGCDASEDPQTAVKSAMLCSKMVWRIVHGYGLEGNFCHLRQPQDSLFNSI